MFYSFTSCNMPKKVLYYCLYHQKRIFLIKDMLNYYYITGTSAGIGRAIAMRLLTDTANRVIGISRNKTIDHLNYTHHTIDLSDLITVADFKFMSHPGARKIYLINNAGTLGLIKPVGRLAATAIIKEYAVNLIAPTVLTNAFIKCYETAEAEKVIVNISSGAGKNPVDGWGVYCASKAGIDMFSRVVALEQDIKKQHSQEKFAEKFNIFSIAPGVVDTGMQDQIRQAKIENFSRIADFVKYKINNELSTPEFVSEKYLDILTDINNIKNVVSSIKDYS